MRCDYLPLGSFARVKGGKRLPPNSQLTQIPTQHPYIRVRDLGNCKTLELNADCQYIDDTTQSMISRYTVSENDIIISIVGTIGLIAKIGRTLDGANLTENCAKIIELKNLDADFLYYYLTSVLGQSEIAAATVGAVQAKLPLKNILTLQVPNLPFSEQKAIAAVLSVLDAKIELNNRINKNLEAQAQALFKSWFVDFEPFRDGEFVESELGPIPKGWGIQTLKMCCNMIARGITPKYTDISGQIVINQKCIRDHQVNLESARYHVPKVQNEKWLKFGDVLVNSTGQGTLGRVAQWFGYNINITVDSHVTIVRPNNQKLIHYLGQFLISRESEIESMASGSTGQTELSRERLGSMSILLPDQDSLDLFSKILEPMMMRVTANNRQSKQLAILRDTLLPKLMSGEIRVPLEV